MTDSGGYLSHHGSLRHSHSTPLTPGSSSGVGMVGSDPARTPPATPKKGGKILAVRVQMLDDSITMFQVQAKALGRLLFDQVCRQLNLLEADYFGLEYTDLTSGARYWLDLEKPLGRQVGLSLCDALLRFCTKFYTPDPAHLEEEFTRYLLCLQVKRDLAQGLLQCNDNTAALMASYIVQSECGDYVVEDYPDHTYLSSYKFVPHQDSELERRIMENHKKHAGQSPAEADLNLLETARRCELYGVKMHPAKDNEGVPLNLAVAHMGIVVFQNYTKINTFSWAKIRKLSFKRKRFLIKLHPEGYGYYKDTVEFFFEGRNECKNFWKKCVEHHGFFRCSSVKMIPRHKARVISRGSSFRYSGRTQKQIVEFVRENYVKRQTFQRSGVVLPRSQSFRHSRCVHSSVASVGTSISAHPLLPLGDNAVAGTPASLSCGSVTLEDPGSPGGRYPGSAPCTSPAHTMEHHHHHHTHHSHQGLSGIGRPTSRQDTLSPATSVASSPSPPPAVTTDTSVGTFGIRDNTPPPPYSGPMVSSLPPPSPRPVVTAVPLESPKNNVNSKSDLQQTVVNNSIILPTPISNNNNNNNAIPVPIEVDVRRKRFPTDRAYFMAKELLMTERTYKKDLEVIDVWLREEVGKEDPCSELEPLNSLINLVSPLLQFHTVLLREVDQRLATWEGRSNAHLKGNYQRIGDILLRNMTLLPLYESYIAHHRVVLEALDLALRQSRRLLTLHRDFEAQKVCYLPLSALSLKPLHRLLHYDRLLDRLTNHYGPQHPDHADCMEAKQKLSTLVQRLPVELRASEGWAQLSELRRHVAGCGEVLAGRQQFLRQGCLMKLSRKGFQQRLFLLFSDVLLYCSRCVPTNGNSLVGSQQEFKVHGQLPLRGLLVEESEERQGAQFCITLGSRGRVTIAAASSAEERERWVQAIITAIKDAENSGSFSPVLSACSSSDEVLPGSEEMPSPQTPQKAVTSTQRSNTSVHVCWHRGASLGLDDQLRAVENQLSGFLLRKFKNSNGWQKLWVVFTNFCLFFYKTFQDDAPLASLPLLGYSVSCPEDKDAIAKDYVFKLQFKTHVYFFRAESEYTFGRWMEVISSATQNQMPIQPSVN